ncbi:MAG TPA: OmpA family protein [Polyangiales bacterium]
MCNYQQGNALRRTPMQVALCACLSGLSACATAAAATKPPAAVVARPSVAQTTVALREPVAANASTATCSAAPIYFPLDSSSLDPAARSQLEQDARCVERSQARQLEIVGMADPRGTEEYNLALGERRAETAANYVSTLGVPHDKVRARSVGEEYAKGNDESGWASDRRDDVQLR